MLCSRIDMMSYFCEKLSQGIEEETWVDKYGEEHCCKYLDDLKDELGGGTDWEIQKWEYTEQFNENGEPI